jgi:hypothetical protein
MIIQVEGASAADVAEARRRLADLARDWGVEITEAGPASAPVHRDGYRGIDPVALASLVVSLPSAALAVADLADRIKKRKRAKDLIDQAAVHAEKRVTAIVITDTRTIELRSLTPDQLIDLAADEAEA